MAAGDRWLDLLDPSAEEIAAAAGVEPSSREAALLVADGEPRPFLFGKGDHAVGGFVVPVAVPAEDRVYYQFVGVVLTRDRVVTVRRTPEDGEPYDPAELQATCDPSDAHPGFVVLELADEIAERFLTLIDELNDEIDEAEDAVEQGADPESVHRRLSDLRHDVLRIRRTLAPTRDAVHRVVDGRLEQEAEGLIDPRDGAYFADVYDKLLRATDALELSRDLVSGVRDYHQARVSQEQNEVVKKLTVIASLLLFPTFVVGVYGQNFDHMPELHWHYGYAFSWAIVVVSTIGQLAFFRWRKWL